MLDAVFALGEVKAESMRSCILMPEVDDETNGDQERRSFRSRWKKGSITTRLLFMTASE